MVKSVVRLTPEERAQLLTLVNTGRAAAKLLHARLLLTADVQDGARRWTDAAIAEALETRTATVQRVRQAWVAQGMEAALARQPPPGRHDRTLDGAQAAQLVPVACRTPPAGRARWPLKV